MSILKGVLKEELEREQKNIVAYQEMLSRYKKGYIFSQEINGKNYCYRKFREGNKIISEYIGLEGSNEAIKAREDYKERKRIESNLRKLKKEEQKLIKALKHYGK